MHLLGAGHVVVNEQRGAGHILFTESQFFVLQAMNEGAMAGAAMGGGVGGLVGSAVDQLDAGDNPPAHLTHPEIACLDAKTKKRLLTTKLLCSIPLGSGFRAKRILWGFEFSKEGHPTVWYRGLIHRQRVLEYLEQRGIPVT